MRVSSSLSARRSSSPTRRGPYHSSVAAATRRYRRASGDSPAMSCRIASDSAARAASTAAVGCRGVAASTFEKLLLARLAPCCSAAASSGHRIVLRVAKSSRTRSGTRQRKRLPLSPGCGPALWSSIWRAVATSSARRRSTSTRRTASSLGAHGHRSSLPAASCARAICGSRECVTGARSSSGGPRTGSSGLDMAPRPAPPLGCAALLRITRCGNVPRVSGPCSSGSYPRVRALLAGVGFGDVAKCAVDRGEADLGGSVAAGIDVAHRRPVRIPPSWSAARPRALRIGRLSVRCDRHPLLKGCVKGMTRARQSTRRTLRNEQISVPVPLPSCISCTRTAGHARREQ
mmetsp:Transcript_10326/g.31953  ORF Transcript_10326/g.31953 Transcript_10326/m.31953 type:complete len:346 (-) Transcript_10326:61-1098(-)